MQIHTLVRKNKLQTKKRVGRGNRHGKTSGRGTKGQSARAGNKKRPELRDIIKKLPKLRGYKFNSIQDKPKIINVGRLQENFVANDEINPGVLLAKKLIKRQSGKIPKVKILATGDINIPLLVTGCIVSAAAAEKITSAGGGVK